VIAGGYCLLDAAASKVATLLPAAGTFWRWPYRSHRVRRTAG
jgi:hypothetical protein